MVTVLGMSDFPSESVIPEQLFEELQEKNQQSGISLGELITVPMTKVMSTLAAKIDRSFKHGTDGEWLAQWFEEGPALLEDMPAMAFLGPDQSANHNAYAIVMAAMMKVAVQRDDLLFADACCTLDMMHTISLPLFNISNPHKQVQPADRAIYEELDRISLKEMRILMANTTLEAETLLANLGWLPVQRQSGDEGWKIMHAREFLGLFFSGQLSLDLS